MDDENEIQIKLVDYKDDQINILITNNDTNFTQKIINRNIIIENLRYKIIYEKVDKMETVIKSKYVPKYTKSENKKIKYTDHSFYDVAFSILNVTSDYLYRISIILVEMFPNYLPEIEHKYSTPILVNTKHGLIDDGKISKLNNYRYGKKMISKSEKEVMKQINSEIEYQELEGILNKNEVKKLTYHNRDFRGISNFVNNNDKFSKKMSEDRKKKVLYTANAKLYFEEKMKKNNIENKFMNNEWFMGPIYSYDHNYKKFI